jgi:alcohol dehydrogenase
VIVGDLLSAVDPRTVAVSALDTAVHAIEVQLSARAQPYAQALAATALRIVAERFDAGLAGARDARVELVLAAGLAVEAFMGTNLGIAHALASPLGTHLGITHDTINAVLGRWAVAFRPDPERLATLADALGTQEPLAALDGLRERAGLPRTLRGLGISWDAVEATLPTAVNSSGIRGAVSLDELRDFARAAWDDE